MVDQSCTRLSYLKIRSGRCVPSMYAWVFALGFFGALLQHHFNNRRSKVQLINYTTAVIIGSIIGNKFVSQVLYELCVAEALRCL